MKRTRFFDRRIIGAMLALGLALLSGCGALQLVYNRADDAVYWWLDAYVDFDAAQSRQVRAALDDYHRWHRERELPGYADLLARIGAAAAGPIDAETVCGWSDEIDAYRVSLLRQAAPALAALAATITPAQLEHIEKRHARSNDAYRADFLQADPAERRQAAFKRWLNRAETLYGRLDDAQRAWLAMRLAQSPFDAERQWGERIARQRDIVRSLRELQRSPPPGGAASAEAEVRSLLERLLRSPDSDFRVYRQELVRDQCGLISELHRRATAAQREHARERAKTWEEDLRALSQRR